MIARTWRGEASRENAEKYLQHLETFVLPELRGIPGHCHSYVLRRPLEGRFEFVVITLWDSIESIRRFAGKDPGKAVVPVEAKRVLSRYDETVTHYEVVNS